MKNKYENKSNNSKYSNNYIENNIIESIKKPDFSQIESKDPSLANGYKIFYNKEVPLDLKLETKEGIKDVGSFQQIKFKILSKVDKNEEKSNRIKIELSWEKDILFHFFNITDENTFLKLKKSQDLNIDFPKYADLVKLLCENCINNPEVYIGEFIIQKEGISKLQFIKVSDFKLLDLVTLTFKNSPDNIIKKHVLYRFGYIKSKLEYNKKALKAAGDVILELNPSIVNPILEENDHINVNVKQYFETNNEEFNV